MELKTYIYKDNNDNGLTLAKIVDVSILEADKTFEEMYPNYKPIQKFPFIGVIIEKGG